jgi:hypothetical protein
MHQEYAQNVYREEKMPDYFSDVIENVINRIDHGSVCDLGSHAIGHYWAMGYIERVESYSCYDLSIEAIQIFKDLMENWKPGDLMKMHPVYMDYLYKNNVIKQTPEIIEKQLVEKLDVVKVFDFLKDKPDKQYDIVLANESLPVVNTYDDLVKAMQTSFDFLKKGGLFLSVSSPYDQSTEEVERMQKYRIEGKLSATADHFRQAMQDVGFKNIKIQSLPINYDNYSQLDISSATR